MNLSVSRRKFLVGCGALALGGVRAESASGRKLDANLVALLSDVHVGGMKNDPDYPLERLRATVDDILSLRPMPANAIVVGDLAKAVGRKPDYRRSEPELRRLAAAGVKLAFAMGNHDRRETFNDIWPEVRAASLRPDRLVSHVETPYADFLVLDTLDQGPDPNTLSPGGGKVDNGQYHLLKNWLSARTKRIFVCAHHPLDWNGLFMKYLFAAPQAVGFLHGHEHNWITRYLRSPLGDGRELRSLGLPSVGVWGDIGWTLLRITADRATAELRMADHYFPRPRVPRPAQWDEIVRERRGAVCTFVFPENKAHT